MKELVNNGYLIQGLYKNNYTSLLEHYEGIEKYVSWPLQEMDDMWSKSLSEEAWDLWFGYTDTLDVVPSKDYLLRYSNHCMERGINLRILKVETTEYSQKAADELEVIDILGIDCIAGVQLSYLNLECDFFRCYFPSICKKTNKYGLFDSIEYAYKFLDRYNQLIDEGLDLEYGFQPTPAKLSIVTI